MDTESRISPNRCECGGGARSGKGDQKDLMICTQPSCKKRWLVLKCVCGNVVDYRFQQCCENDYPKCDLKPIDVCIHGSKAIIGHEGVMYCNDDQCSCHHSRWAYHKCEHCGHAVDYRYAAMCICKECMKSKQYYRICPVCGQCPSQTQKDKNVEVVRSTKKKKSCLTAPKQVATKKPDNSAQLSLTS